MLSVPPDVICCEKKQTRKTTAYMDGAEQKSKKGMLPQHPCPDVSEARDAQDQLRFSRAAEQLKVAF